MKKKKDGFTLVEIMFVVTIIGLLASMGIPALLNAMESAKDRVKQAHIAAVEKAKATLTLPALVYECGKSVQPGTSFGVNDYTEENLMACIKIQTRLLELKVGDSYLIPGDIDSRAYYTDSEPTYVN